MTESRDGEPGAGQTETAEVRLRRRPEGMPSLDDFEVGSVTLAEPGAGEVLLRTLWLSVDPYMRGRMRDVRSYVPPFQLGRALAGGGIGEVVASNAEGLQPGELVQGNLRWRGHDVQAASHLERLDPGDMPPQAYLGALGMPGMTAYVGLYDIGQPVGGETVLVSGAAGAVGSVVGQLAKLRGCTVIGTAGGARKLDYLSGLGFDAVIDYREAGDLSAAVARTAPQGVDVYFDNVGGDHLKAALSAMNDFGRLVLCGAISAYNAEAPVPGPPNLALAVSRRLRLQGFIVSDHASRRPDFLADMSRWVAEGKIRQEQTVVEGLERAPQAFIGLFKGENLGKMLVKVAN